MTRRRRFPCTGAQQERTHAAVVLRDFSLGIIDGRDVGEKPVAAPGHGLDEARTIRGVAKRFSKLADGFVEAVIKVDRGLWPKPAVQFLAGHQLARPVQ